MFHPFSWDWLLGYGGGGGDRVELVVGGAKGAGVVVVYKGPRGGRRMSLETCLHVTARMATDPEIAGV